MIAKDNLPLNTIEKSGFIKLLKIAAPLYKPPKRKYITKCMDEKYKIISVMFKNELKKLSIVVSPLMFGQINIEQSHFWKSLFIL